MLTLFNKYCVQHTDFFFHVEQSNTHTNQKAPILNYTIANLQLHGTNIIMLSLL